MPYREYSNQWIVVRQLPNSQQIVLKRYRKRSDAEGHLVLMRQQMTKGNFVPGGSGAYRVRCASSEVVTRGDRFIVGNRSARVRRYRSGSAEAIASSKIEENLVKNNDRKLLSRITFKPEAMIGKPAIQGTRLTIDFESSCTWRNVAKIIER